jgi:hypothetical protein
MRRQIITNKNKAVSISAVPNAPDHGSDIAGQCRVGIDWTPTVTVRANWMPSSLWRSGRGWWRNATQSAFCWLQGLSAACAFVIYRCHTLPFDHKLNLAPSVPFPALYHTFLTVCLHNWTKASPTTWDWTKFPQLWRWRLHVPPKRRCQPTKSHGVKTKTTTPWTILALKATKKYFYHLLKT